MDLPTGTKGCARHVALAAPFVPVGITNRDPGQKGDPGPSWCPFVPAWHCWLGNRDNRGFPTGTNQCFCSSEGHQIWEVGGEIWKAYQNGSPFAPLLEIDF